VILGKTYLAHDPILAKRAPIESPVRELLSGAGFIQFGAILRKPLSWAKQIDAFLKYKKMLSKNKKMHKTHFISSRKSNGA